MSPQLSAGAGWARGGVLDLIVNVIGSHGKILIECPESQDTAYAVA